MNRATPYLVAARIFTLAAVVSLTGCATARVSSSSLVTIEPVCREAAGRPQQETAHQATFMLMSQYAA